MRCWPTLEKVIVRLQGLNYVFRKQKSDVVGPDRAGDIGHVRVHGADDVLCVCGNYGCVEAVASAPAILRQLRQLDSEDGTLPSTWEELAAALQVNAKVTVGLVREAASQLGEVVASLVHFYNPARIVVGGGLTVPSDDMLAGIRAVVYRRALPLATRNLVISQPTLGEWSGTLGGRVIGIEHALKPEMLCATVEARLANPGSAPMRTESTEPTVFACRAVLFDCDGVLVDSDPAVERAWSRWAVARGLDPAEVLAQVHGRRSADTVSLLVPPELSAERRRRSISSSSTMPNRFPPYPACLCRYRDTTCSDQCRRRQSWQTGSGRLPAGR
jgi:predicted NBD/HSP70 family sugar kinase